MKSPSAMLATLSAAMLFAACVSPALINMNVKAYTDPDRPPQTLKSFRTVPVNLCQQNALLEKQMLQLVRQRLEAPTTGAPGRRDRAA